MADLTQQAFTAGQNWWHTGQHTSGVANARVVRYGFLKWWNNQSPSATRGHSKGYPEKAFREGWNRGKKGPQRIPNGRLVPARIRHKGKTYPGKVKRVNGRVKIFVTPQVARKINPQAKFYETIAHGIGKVYQGPSKTLALTAGRKYSKAGRYTDVYCDGEVIKQFQHYTGKATAPKKNRRRKR